MSDDNSNYNDDDGGYGYGYGDDWNGGQDEDGYGYVDGNDGYDEDYRGGEDDQVEVEVDGGYGDDGNGYHDYRGGEDGYHDGGQGHNVGEPPDEADPRHFDYRYTQDQLGEWVYNEGGHDDKNERHGQQDDVGVERDSNQGGYGDRYQQGDDRYVPSQYRGSIESGDSSGYPQYQDVGSQDQPYQQDRYSDEQGRGYQDLGNYSTKGVYSDFIESVRYSPSEYQQGDHEEERRYELLRLWNKEHDLVYEDRDRWWPTADELEVHNETGYRRAFDRNKETQRAIVNGYDLDDDKLDVIQWLKDAKDLDSCVREKMD